MFAALGPISFNTLASPTRDERTRKFHYQKLDVIGAAPVLQWIYDDLSDLELDVTFHQLWCNPVTSIKALEQLAETHQPQSLVYGDGTHRGQWVILEISVKQVWQADNGNIIAAECKLKLQFSASGATTATTQPGSTFVGTPPAIGTVANQTPAVVNGGNPTVEEALTLFTQTAATEAALAYAGIEIYFYALVAAQLIAFSAALFSSPTASIATAIPVVEDFTAITVQAIARWGDS